MSFRFAIGAACIAGVALGLASAGARAQNQDPFGAAFDADRPLQIEGRVIELQWVNPRSWLLVSAIGPNGGAATDYAIQLPPPSALLRRGWIREQTLPPGASVVIDGDLARDGQPRMLARRVVTADGTVLLDLDDRPMSYAVSGAEIRLRPSPVPPAADP